jgi:hypothetical protein
MEKGEDIYRKPGRRDSAEAVIDMVREAGGVIAEPDPNIDATTPIYAFLDHGRWLGECGLWDASRGRICKNAQFVDTDDARFYCITCANVEVAGRWREVIWPEDTNTVEEPLAELPVEEQNWTPEE